MTNEDYVENIYKELEDKRGNAPAKKSFFQTMDNKAMLLLGLAVLLLCYLKYSEKIDNKTFWFWIIGIAAVLIIMTFNVPKDGPLTEQELKIILYNKLKWKQRHPLGNSRELPEGDIKMGLCGRERFLKSTDGGAKPWKRAIQFSVMRHDDLELHYTAEVDVYTGDPITLMEGRFDGTEHPDVEILQIPKEWKTMGTYRGMLRGMGGGRGGMM